MRSINTAQTQQFERVILPHLDAAYNLARWIVQDDRDAEDVVQEACLRALKFFGGFRGEEGRPWLLSIVRNVSYTWLHQHRSHEIHVEFDEEKHAAGSSDDRPDTAFERKVDSETLKKALEGLPVEIREVIVLRELECLSYKEIAGLVEIPIGTVMSRLARGRERLQRRLVRPGRGD